MKSKISIYLAVAASIFMVACQQNEPMEFADKGRVLFYEEGTNFQGLVMRVSEKNYSFTLVPFEQNQIEAFINVRLMGKKGDRDRIFRAMAVKDSTTAVEGTHFKLHDGVMKTGEFWSQLPITLYRTADIQEKAVRIMLRLIPTDDLQGGVEEGSEYGFFSLIVADYILPPQNWPTTYFGAYSDNKYKFVMSVLGIDNFPMQTKWDSTKDDNKFTVSQMYTFKYELQLAYAEYRKTNPPIYEDDNAENKVEISF